MEPKDSKEGSQQESPIKIDEEEEDGNSPEYHRRLIERIKAEMAAEDALPPEIKMQKDIDLQTKSLLEHLKPQYQTNFSRTEVYRTHFPQIFIQQAPWSARGAACKLWVCDVNIKPSDYRISLRPGMENFYNAPDYFHIHCFEKLLLLSSPEVLPRLQVESLATHKFEFLLDKVAERLAKEWISRHGPQNEDENTNGQTEDTACLYPGSSEDDTRRETQLDSKSTAARKSSLSTEDSMPIQSDSDGVSKSKKRPRSPSPGDLSDGSKKAKLTVSHDSSDRDIEEPVISSKPTSDDESESLEDDGSTPWNPVDYLAVVDDPIFHHRHDLSRTLQSWRTDQFLATSKDSELNEKGIEMKNEMNPKTIKAIRRIKGMA